MMKILNFALEMSKFRKNRKFEIEVYMFACGGFAQWEMTTDVPKNH